MENEIWKPIPGFESYQVSSRGRCMGPDGKIKKCGLLKSGYVRATFRNSQGSHSRRVHRLVAMAFLENPNNYPDVNHKDTDKTNNHYTNLEWCTQQMNMDHAVKHGLNVRGTRVNTCKLTEYQVQAIRAIYDAGGASQRNLATQFGVAKNAIKMIVNRKSWKHI